MVIAQGPGLGHRASTRTTLDSLTWDTGILEADRERLIDYIRNQIHGFHEGKLIRHRPRPRIQQGLPDWQSVGGKLFGSLQP